MSVSGSGGAVLVIHADEYVRTVIDEILRDEGYRPATSGYDAWRTAIDGLDRRAPLAAVLDAYGPARCVIEALGRRHGSVPVILLSTAPALLDRTGLPTATVLPEPFAIEDLVAALRQATGVPYRGDGCGGVGRARVPA